MKDIAISVLVLFSCAILTLYGMVYLGMRNPSQYLSEHLVASLSKTGTFSLATTGIGRTYLKELSIQNISLEQDEKLIASAERATIKGGFPLLLQSFLKGDQNISLELEQVDVDLDASMIVQEPESTPSPTVLQWFERNTVSVQSDSLDGRVRFGSLDTEIDQAAFSLVLDAKENLPSLQTSARLIAFTHPSLSLSLQDPMLTLSPKGVVSLTSSQAILLSDPLEGSLKDFVAQGSLSGLNLPSDIGDVSLSAADLETKVANLLISIPELSGGIALQEGNLSDATLAFDQMTVSGDELIIKFPTTTLQGSFQEDRITLGSATKLGEPLSFQIQDALSFSGNGVSVNARYLFASKSITASAFLHELSYQRDSLMANLNSLYLDTEAQIVDSSIEKASLTLSSLADVGFDSITASSPMEATLGYEREGQALSASFTFNALESTFTKGPLYTRLSYQENSAGSQLQAEITRDEQLSLLSVYDIPNDGKISLYLSTRLEEFPLSFLNPTLIRYAPFLQPYYQEDTKVIGNINFRSTTGGGTVMPLNGSLAIDLALREAKVGKVELDAGFTFQGEVTEDILSVDAMTIATSGYRLVYAGQTNLSQWLPRGTLDLFRSDDGQRLGSIAFSDEPPKQYRFLFTTPFEQSLSIAGRISTAEGNMLVGDAELAIYDTLYPFQFLLQTSTLQFSLSQENAFSLSTNLAPPIDADVTASKLRLPDRGFFANALISGDMNLAFNNLQEWGIRSEKIHLSNVTFQGQTYALETSIALSQDSLVLPQILLTDDENATFVSSLSYRGTDFISLLDQSYLAPFEAFFTLYSNNERKIAISLMGEDRRISAVMQLSNLPLDRFFSMGTNVVIDLDMLGYTDLRNVISLDGTLALNRGDASFFTKLEAANKTLNLYESSFIQGDLTYDGNLLLIQGGKALSEGKFSHIRHLSYTDQESRLSYTLALDLPEVEDLFDLPLAIGPLLEGRAQAVLSLSDILVFGEEGFSDGVYSITLAAPEITVDSDLLTFSYSLDTQELSAKLLPQFGIGFSAYGSLSEKDFGLIIEDIHLPLNLLNRTFLKPIFSFLDGTVQGELFIGGTKQAIRPYGQLYVNSSRMDLFWLPQDIITMKNVTVTIDGTRAVSPKIPFFSTNTTTGKTVEGYGSLGSSFDGLTLLNYEIHADSEDEMLYVWIPMQGFDVDIRTYASGTFNLFGVGFETWLDGDVTIQDTTISLGIKDLPYWYEENNLTTTEFSVVTGRNVSFFYPNTPNPFIQATITENQEINFSYDHIIDEFIIDGNLSFRSGEFYYFQKNFFITEGSLSLHTDALSGVNTIQPSINLRAKLTDFDAQGERVDIYLVLRESSLTNLNPQFESTPPKDTNEILEILGQSILPTGAYGQVNLYSVASLAAAATDVAERLGYLQTSQTTQLTESIRTSLGLDMFSIRSNILQNILIDALPGSSLATISPLARYLNNTTIFMGKYIGEQYFLQALLHLTASEKREVKRSFISPDLSLDLELSLDWQNPVGTFSFFTQPNELSFINILDTIGFSVTRRFVLR
ncbi:MAG: hypothetical protein AB7D92_01490 [Sphaerochaeta sp.]